MKKIAAALAGVSLVVGVLVPLSASAMSYYYQPTQGGVYSYGPQYQSPYTNNSYGQYSQPYQQQVQVQMPYYTVANPPSYSSGYGQPYSYGYNSQPSYGYQSYGYQQPYSGMMNYGPSYAYAYGYNYSPTIYAY